MELSLPPSGFAFERPEDGTVDVTIPTDFGIYNRLQFVDAETGEVLAQYTDEQELESFAIDANGEPDRLIVVQQGRWETPRNKVSPPPPWGWPNAEQGQLNVWARSGFTIDGTQATFVRINGAE